MDGTILSSVEPVLSDICDVYSIDHLKYSTQNRPTVIKYTKLHEYDETSSPQQFKGPRLRRVTEVSKEPKETSRSLKSSSYISPPVVPYSTKRKVVIIDDNVERPLHKNTGGNKKRSIDNNFLKKSSSVLTDNQLNSRYTSRIRNTNVRENTLEDTTISSKNMKRSTASDKNRQKHINAKEKGNTNNKKSNYNFKKGKKKEASLSKEKSYVYEQLMRPVSPEPPSFPIGFTHKLNIDDFLGTCHTIHVPLEESCGYMVPQPKITEIDMNDHDKNEFDQSKVQRKNKKVHVKPDTAAKVTETINNLFDSNREYKMRTHTVYQNKVPLYECLYIPNCTLKKDNKVVELSDDKTISVVNDTVRNLDNFLDMTLQSFRHIEEIPNLTMAKLILSENDTEVTTTTPLVETTKQISPNILQYKNNAIVTSPKILQCEKHFEITPSTPQVENNTEATSPNFSLFEDVPNLTIPSLKIAKQNTVNVDEVVENESSFIIGHATVTYTTEQKINFQVMGSKDIVNPAPESSYPMNVVTILKAEMSQKKVDSTESITNIPSQMYCSSQYHNISDIQSSINYAFKFNGDDLKPSYIINSIARSIGVFNNIVISEQFQKELDFIDSFMESLQYLQNCSMFGKPTIKDLQKSYKNLIRGKLNEIEYKTMIAKQNTRNASEAQIYASKSLCLLNMLIRDEQKRAKDLLFVLKMREDALKDFTKSQILWLENKKKHDSTDASTLKKKQRGALLKLQHECGEMEKMRKALLSLSERRKTALLNTMRTIELKLSANETIEKPVSQDKQLMNSDCPTSPVKCYELPSTTSNSESQVVAIVSANEKNEQTEVISAKKSTQTGNSILSSLKNNKSSKSKKGASCVVVEGGYLNILFDNLAMPRIFCEGKHYDMNEDELKNIITLSNVMRYNPSENRFIEKLVEEVRIGDGESTPSTARSLVEELEQYYKQDSSADINYLATEIASQAENESVVIYGNANFEKTNNESGNQMTYSDYVKTLDSKDSQSVEECSCTSRGQMSSDALSSSVSGIQLSAIDSPMLYELSSMPTMGVWQPTTPNDTAHISTETTMNVKVVTTDPCPTLKSTQVVSEAEELRRQQLAIEQEIKALEQQQCLLLVREIPDKPPPPYMPPPAGPRNVRRYMPDDGLEVKVQKYLHEDKIDLHIDSDDSFEVYVKDFCLENAERQREAQGEKPWDAANLLVKNIATSVESIQQRTTSELREVLTGAISGSITGSASHKSDHIDKILFNEWRRCEPEWTSLHVDEVAVKNQLFDIIFQKILAETVDAYKDIVVNPPEKKD